MFLAGRSVAEIRREFARRKEFRQPLVYLEQVVRDYDGIPPENRDLTRKPDPKKKSPPPYHPLDQVTAGAALATGSKVWRDLARATLRRLVLMHTWCRQNHPARLMGGDNDMVIGHPLLALSMLYHYLRDELTRQEYALTLAKAREYGQKLYDFSVLQKRYATGMGHILSHESCPLLGLGVCAMVFWDDIPEAPRWLAWTHGRMLAGAKDAPRDGRNPWSTYGPNFLTSYACAVDDFAGEKMWRIPFFRNLGSALIRSEPMGSRLTQYNLRWIMAALATYTGNAEAAWEWRDLWRLQSQHKGAEHFLGWQDMLWCPRPLAHARGYADRFRKSFLFKDTGFALMRTDDEPASISCFYQSGLAVGRAGFEHRKRYSMEHHDAHADGGVSIFVRGAPIVGPAPSQYRRGFPTQSVVTVNGGGHYLDGRVLGTWLKRDWLSRMLSFHDTKQRTVAVGDNTGAYREELGVLRSRRRVALIRDRPALQIEDSIRLRRPQRVAARFQCTGRIQKLGAGLFRFHATSGEYLDLRVSSAGLYRIRIGKAQMVLPYSYGFNVTKGRRTQPVIVKSPPRPQFLEVAVPGRTTRANFRVSFRVVA